MTRLISVLFILLFSQSVLAFNSSFECTRASDRSFNLDLTHFGFSTYWDAQMGFYNRVAGRRQNTNFSMFQQATGRMNRLIFIGNGQRLEIDLWPDQTPRSFRNYRATLRSMNYLRGSIATDVNCFTQFFGR